jgi:uncharacterized NAD(P)/FAD-binding protein YdhS
MKPNSKRTIVVVGAGFAGYRFIAESVRLTELQGLTDAVRYVVIDRRPIGQYGRGIAWTGTQSEVLRANMNSATIVLGTEQNNALLTSIEKLQADKNPISTLYQSRKEIGEKIHQDFLRVLSKVSELGIEFHPLEASVTCISKKGIGYSVETDDGGDIFADTVVLALGHFPSRNFQDLGDCVGFIESAWDWERLKAIPLGKRIGLLGMGPTAVDAALVLSEHGQQEITALSRTGLMQYPRPRHSTATLAVVSEGLFRSLANSFGGLTVEMLVALAAAEFNQYPGSWEKIQQAFIDSSKPPAQSLRLGYARSDDIEDWFSILTALERFVPLVWSLLREDQRKKFTDLHRSISNLAYGMAPPQALRVLEMLDEGRLRTRARLRNVRFENADSSFLAEFSTAEKGKVEEEKFDVLIDCSGFGRDLSKAPWQFVGPMIQNGLLWPANYGGGHVDFKSGQVTDKAGRPIAEIYCLAGSLTIGSHFVTNGLSKVARTAHQSATHIHRKLDLLTATSKSWEEIKALVEEEIGEVS